ncbi:hypothetical protein [Caulobacter sp. BE254]|uniref:hypothetical protein n=1 Tax=Caulobacter sp. BE254 TaxID=2817720 RepID=UPI00285AB55D|nr:hypothetical protein [Caulobacter sp. BE254]MDR7114266.1 hypothetical protein [Caulobacter sp. BE254]
MTPHIARSEIEDVPFDYAPYSEVNFCSNKLTNVRFLIEIAGSHPILIGQGAVPYVWVRAPADKSFSKWTPAIERNAALSPQFVVTVSNGIPSISSAAVVEIFAFGKRIIRIVRSSKTSIDIDMVDLTPIGINMIGDKNGLRVGGMSFSKSSMNNVGTFIGLGR